MSFILKKYLSREYFSLKAQGNSMFPLLLSDDIIFYKKTGFKEIKTNDLVLISKNKEYFTHRVIYKNGDYFVTKGDNNLKADGRIFPSQLVGQVIKIKRNNQIRYPENQYLIQSTLYFQEIIKITEALKKASIDFIFLKGLPLHLYFEKSHPKRIYADCDLLIDKTEVRNIDQILITLGYKKIDTSFNRLQKILKGKEIESSYYKIINGYYILFDIHLEVTFLMTQLGRLGCLYPQELIDQLTLVFLRENHSIAVKKNRFLILTNDNLIVYLALHLFHHNFNGAFRLELLDRVIRKTPHLTNTFKNVNKTVKKFKLENFVFPSFLLLKKYYHTPIPKNFITSIKPVDFWVNKHINKLVQSNIFDDETRVEAGIARFKNLFYLSPQPFWKKVFVFLNIEVFYMIMLIFMKKTVRLFKKI